MNIQLIVIFFVGSCGAVGLLLWPLVTYLRKSEILDHPNERSSHEIATPKGAGLVLVPVVGAAWFGAALVIDDARLIEISVLVAGGFLLAVISWIDDLKGLSSISRLAAHTVTVTAVIVVSPNLAGYFDNLVGPGLGTAFAVVLWVWFINLFNFMDGIDGISGVNILTTSGGTALIIFVTNSGDPQLMMYASIIAGAAVGFLIWNWPPARVFLGDVGSAPLGLFVGWLLLSLLQAGHYIAALILPAYYLVDATLTLVKRAARTEKFWQAHHEHYYQLAIRRGVSHGRVCCTILLLNAAMIALALIGTLWSPSFALVGAIVLVLVLLTYFRGGIKTNNEEKV